MLTKVIKNILNSPSVNGGKKHEKFIESELIIGGFKPTKLPKKELREYMDNLNKKQSNHKNVFVSQPFGSQGYPDFIVFEEDGTIRAVEAKSSKGDKITWNSGYPREGGIYILSSGRYNKQTVSLGDDLWTTEERQKQLLIRKKCEELSKELNKELCMKENYDSDFYMRAMHNDGKKIYGNKDRELRENKVFDVLGGQ